MQTVAKNRWHWDSKQRTQRKHTGEPFKLFLDIDKPGRHVVTVAMREDGAELDRFVFTTKREAGRPKGLGPGERVAVVDDILAQGRTAEALGQLSPHRHR